jgi:hypothetical protein
MTNPLDVIMANLPPQTRQQVHAVYMQAMQSGNPEQFIMQRYGNNDAFRKAFEVKNGKSPEEFNNYLGNISRSMNGLNR